MRIGELSRRVRVTPERLRAWERRYGLLRPQRTPSGYRLYTEDDERRVLQMQAALDRGVAAAEAAAAVLAARPMEGAASDLERLTGELADALAAFDAVAAEAALDRLLAGFSLDTVIRDALMPYLYELGERWAGGDISVAQEHYASRLVEARLLSLTHGWDEGTGPVALLACPSGELHNLGLVAFGLALHRLGWRIAYLGADTPASEVTTAATARDVDAVVLSSTTPGPFLAAATELRALAKRTRLFVGGAGATAAVARKLGAERLDADPVTAAAQLA